MISFVSNRNSLYKTSRTDFALDTICTITIYDSGKDAENAIEEAFKLCHYYDHMLSTTISSSDIYAINHSNGKTVSVNSETAELINRAMQYCELSGSAFDITILPVKSLWSFSGDDTPIPNKDAISAAAELVDYKRVELNDNLITLPAGMGIDLGGIAKGFIADKLAESLRANNVSSAVIDLGGNIYTIGTRNDGTNWRIGIKKPFDENGDNIYTVNVSDKSVVTSGVYQRYFRLDNQIYHHILSSSTGMPVNTGLYSVTIISENSEQCDALATICMLLGYEKSITLLDSLTDVKAIFITDSFELIKYN